MVIFQKLHFLERIFGHWSLENGHLCYLLLPHAEVRLTRHSSAVFIVLYVDLAITILKLSLPYDLHHLSILFSPFQPRHKVAMTIKRVNSRSKTVRPLLLSS